MRFNSPRGRGLPGATEQYLAELVEQLNRMDEPRPVNPIIGRVTATTPGTEGQLGWDASSGVLMKYTSGAWSAV